MVRQRSAKPLSPVQIRVSPPVHYLAGVVELVDTRDFKIPRALARAGSSPASGTKREWLSWQSATLPRLMSRVQIPFPAPVLLFRYTIKDTSRDEFFQSRNL